MGIGDNIMASGMARDPASRGKRAAFGNKFKRAIYWDQNSEVVFRGNPHIAPPGSERAGDLEWIEFYRGHRIYNKQGNGCWIWNYDFRPVPGQVFLDPRETRFGERAGRGFVVIEPNVPAFKSVAPNKQWPPDRYEHIATELRRRGYDVVQMVHAAGNRLKNARHVGTPHFRLAMAVLKQASLYIGPEGGLHHAAAALGRPAVVLFGGFIPPSVTGYDTHRNLTGGAEACGKINRCDHCIAAMRAISCDEVLDASQSILNKECAA